MLTLFSFSFVKDGFRINFSCDQTTQTDAVWEQKSSSESEMESEEDNPSNTYDCLSKRLPPRRKANPIKRPRFIKPTVPVESVPSTSAPLRPDEVFEKAETEVHPKKIELRLAGSLHLEKGECNAFSDLSITDPAGFGVIHPPPKPLAISDDDKTVDSNEIVEDGSVITAEELASNRIPSKGILLLVLSINACLCPKLE